MSEGAHLWCEQRQERPWTGRGRAASRESPARSRSPPSAIMKWTPAKNRKSYILYNNLQIPYIKRNKEMAMKNTTFFMFQVSSLLYGMCNNKLRMPKIKRLKWRKIIRRSLALKTELKQKSLFVFRKKLNIFPICEYFSVIFQWQCCFHLKFSCKKMCRCYNNVADPDPEGPDVFGPPGSGSISQKYGSGSFYHQKVTVPTVPVPVPQHWLKRDLNF